MPLLPDLPEEDLTAEAEISEADLKAARRWCRRNLPGQLHLLAEALPTTPWELEELRNE